MYIWSRCFSNSADCVACILAAAAFRTSVQLQFQRYMRLAGCRAAESDDGAASAAATWRLLQRQQRSFGLSDSDGGAV
jgi:hypothetical protein